MELGKMKIELNEIPIREVVAGYKDSAEEGVTGYGVKLNIRPKFQREFICNEKERNAVIKTVKNKFPLNNGGTTTAENCQVLCAKCNGEKSNT